MTVISETINTVTEAFQINRISIGAGLEVATQFTIANHGSFLACGGTIDTSATIADIASSNLIITEHSGTALDIGTKIIGIRVRLTNGDAGAVILGCRVWVTTRKLVL